MFRTETDAEHGGVHVIYAAALNKPRAAGVCAERNLHGQALEFCGSSSSVNRGQRIIRRCTVEHSSSNRERGNQEVILLLNSDQRTRPEFIRLLREQLCHFDSYLVN